MNNTSHLRSLLRRGALALIACALMVPAILLNVNFVQASTAAPQQVQGRVTIPGHLVPALRNHTSLHASASSRQLQLSIALNLRNRDQLNALLSAQNDPASSYYHHYLTPQEFTNLFGPTPATVSQVVNYLTSQGLKVNAISPNNTLIDATASVAMVEKAFNTSISDYSFDGRSVYAPSSEPSVPASLAGIILNISGLDNVAQYRHYDYLKTRPAAGSGPAGGYTPTELRTAYDMNSLISSADGTGQTTAIFELDGYKASDVNAYLSYYGLGSAKYSNVLVDGASNTAGSGAIEVELDMEVISAIAPGATQKIYIGPNSTSGVNDTYNRIVTDDLAPVTSISWGLCESSSGTSELAALDNIFVQGAAQGQSFFAASGDSGAYDCGTSSLAVDSPADDPYVVGVGGTALTLTGSSTYGSESVWSSGSGSSGEGGGGGYSTYFSKPSYQTGTGVSSNAYRHVPDVSADADPNTGYSVYCTVSASGCSSSSAWIVVGGTSAAAPLWAAVATDTNEYLTNLGKSTLGAVNAKLYTLFNTTQSYTAYHDITTGNNLYYSATTGYDVASGIGSPDVWNFARDAANGSGGGTTPTPTPTVGTTPTPTVGTTPTPTPTATGTVTQLLGNPGFESGAGSPWVESSRGGYEIVDNSNPHSGSYEAWLCGYNNCSDAIYQTVTLPSTTTKVVLSYWVYIATNESGSTCYDYFYARLRTSSGATISTVQTKCNANASGWTHYTFDVTSALSGYAGKSIQVYFLGTTDSSLITNFFVDDVALNVTH